MIECEHISYWDEESKTIERAFGFEDEHLDMVMRDDEGYHWSVYAWYNFATGEFEGGADTPECEMLRVMFYALLANLKEWSGTP